MSENIIWYLALKKILTPFNNKIDAKLKNKSSIKHEIDLVTGTEEEPLILIDNEYIECTVIAQSEHVGELCRVGL